MLRVRFPNGQCVQYNDATDVEFHSNGEIRILHVKEAKRWWLASVAPGSHCIIEWQTPCAVTNPVAREMTPESALALVTRHLRTLPSYKIRDLKVALQNFNARRHIWKNP
jgi:hypothetical protein